MVFIAADFYIRAFTPIGKSPVTLLSSFLTKALNLNKKAVGKAQKIFAARLGFLMTLSILILMFLNYQIATIVVGSILLFFATLEFALGVCFGCIIYSYLVMPFYGNK